jgi:hypothetical protein
MTLQVYAKIMTIQGCVNIMTLQVYVKIVTMQ